MHLHMPTYFISKQLNPFVYYSREGRIQSSWETTVSLEGRQASSTELSTEMRVRVAQAS